jgi:hypothetical protein
MTIHGPLETVPQPDPVYDAVGRAIESATVIESWLNVLASMVAGLRHDESPWSKVSDKVRTAVRLRLLPEHQPTVQAAITEGERLLKTRNGLVHGVWVWGDTISGDPGFQSQRPPRGKTPPMITAADGELVPEWTKETFTCQRLLVFSNDCQRLAALIQGALMTWTEHLHDEE